jgi:cell division FtsZ-interacting protein ZapD
MPRFLRTGTDLGSGSSAEFGLIGTHPGKDAMLEKLRQEVMKRGMQLMTNPKVMKMMADPRFMNAISKGFQIKGQIQNEIDGRLRSVADTLNLATRSEVENLQRNLSRMQTTLTNLEKKVNS